MLFQGLFKRAERSIDSAISRLVGRATVAVPLLVAGGFATAALSLKLVELYGAVSAYALMAVLFATIGLVTMAVNHRESEPAAEADATADAARTSQEAGEEGASSELELPPEVMALLSSAAPAAVPAIARGVFRNLPLIFILAVVVFLISRFAQASEDLAPSEADAEAPSAS